MSWYLSVEDSFDAAHFLKGYDGKCARLHGHRWRVIATFKSNELKQDMQNRGMVIDFNDAKRALTSITQEQWDHSFIYEADSMSDILEAHLKNDFDWKLNPVPFRPTAEEFARYLYHEFLVENFPIYSVTVYETPTNKVEYKEEN